MFNQKELKNLQIFLTRVRLTGNEALPLVLLQQKVTQLIAVSQELLELPQEQKLEPRLEPKVNEKNAEKKNKPNN